MINVKLIVLFICVSNIRECYCDYCRICPSHTLCMYKRPGPSRYCRSYDKSALITKEDVETIVNKVNQRRNFVALGLARNLPSAANMNQMQWSEELALSAQRWADQCDPAIRPDKKDYCRDLVDKKVGQSIATVMGLSPGLNVKSFVEMWYMQALDYNGSVTYYNQSEGRNTDDFTQLIWAETTQVGCGKARFSIDDKGTMIDRFVCNFAPKGNVRGKPVYTIGYPATQCKENSYKDDIFTGLCKSVTETSLKTTASTPSSLLRIINLPNKSVKLDIDPLRHDYKNREMNQDMLNFMRHQNLRHIPNNTRGFVHHITPARQQNKQDLPNMAPWHDIIPRQYILEHPRNIHGNMYKTRSPIEHYKRNDYYRETVNPNYYDFNSIRRTFSGQCTRNKQITQSDSPCQWDSEIVQPHCSRTSKESNEYILTTQSSCKKKDHATINPCDEQKLTCMLLNPVTTPYNCHCLNIDHASSENHRRIPGEYVYYDYPPNLSLRVGEEFEDKRPIKHRDRTNLVPITAPSLSANENNANPNRGYFNDIQMFGFNKQVTQTRRSYRKNLRNRFLINPRVRSKRQTEKQFSDIDRDEEESLKQLQKRSPLYTTLRYPIKRKFKPFSDKDVDSEPITISTSDFNKHHHDSTDRSLSFEELMHFRKNRGGEIDFNMRRKNKNEKKSPKPETSKPTTPKPKPTTSKPKTTKPKTTKSKIPTSKTPLRSDGKKKLADTIPTTVNNSEDITRMTLLGTFSPQSACTRRNTCTWTMPVITDANGKIINQNGGGSGSGGGGGGGGGFPNGRTPWGHVENCTRRYTCSRIYYNRNVQASDTVAGDTTLPDEDYCERRALDVQKKDLNDESLDDSYENPSAVTPSMKYDSTGDSHNDYFREDRQSRRKRSHGHVCTHKEKKVPDCKFKKKETSNVENENNNLYALSFAKVLQLWGNSCIKRRKTCSGCPCNASVIHTYNLCHLFILLYFLRLLN